MPANDAHAPSASGRATLLLSSERTFLAQTRTGIAIMAFGFVVARFALFLRGAGVAPPSHATDVWVGAAITALGAGVVLVGAIRLRHRAQALAHGVVPAGATGEGQWLAALLTVLGLGLALYLASQAYGRA